MISPKIESDGRFFFPQEEMWGFQQHDSEIKAFEKVNKQIYSTYINKVVGNASKCGWLLTQA